MPVFSGGVGGLQSIIRPGFGFIIGFIFASYVVGTIFYKFKPSKITVLISILMGKLIIYIVGLSYMFILMEIYMGKSINLGYVLKVGLIPFIPGAIIKIIIIYYVAMKYFRINGRIRTD